jgi:3-oxoacyl-[acyl-carrier protein] reductase
MMFQLKDQVAVVTGASQGIGEEIALQMAQAGAKVVLAARNEGKLAVVAARIEAAGGAALALPMDVSDPARIKAVFGQVVAQFGRLDILVNNAGITRDGLAVRMKPDDWDAVLRTDLTGVHLCIQQAIVPMLRQRRGRIINVSSVVAQMGNPGQANYVAAKAGVIGLTRALALELASRNITVNAVAPGFITTDMTAALSEKTVEQLAARVPLGRLGSPADVAAAVLFLASDEAAYITGHVLSVNGGMYMG